jgi:Spy/CpxP family protein refolding chaperone
MLIKRISTILAAGLLIVALGGLADAQRPFARMANLKTRLALTEQQFSDIGGVLKKHQDAAFPLKQELRAKNHELKSALAAPEPNPTAVGQLVLARRALRTRLRAINGKLRGDIAARLNPEQKQKFDSLKGRPWRHGSQP